jgi:hypothetical protein
MTGAHNRSGFRRDMQRDVERGEETRRHGVALDLKCREVLGLDAVAGQPAEEGASFLGFM